MAGSWMTISNNLEKSSLGSTPRIGLTNFIWAVEEMGRNSVSPSTTDWIMAWVMVIFGYWLVLLSLRNIAKISITNPPRMRMGARVMRVKLYISLGLNTLPSLLSPPPLFT